MNTETQNHMESPRPCELMMNPVVRMVAPECVDETPARKSMAPLEADASGLAEKHIGRRQHDLLSGLSPSAPVPPLGWVVHPRESAHMT